MSIGELKGRELDEACAIAMGWIRSGSKWRPPGVATCLSGPNATAMTHERTHRKRLLPRFSSDSGCLASLLLWLRERDGFDLAADFVDYTDPKFRIRWPVGQGDHHEFAGETPNLAAARAAVQVAQWDADGGGRED